MIYTDYRKSFAPDQQVHHSDCRPTRRTEQQHKLFARCDEGQIAELIVEGLGEFKLPENLAVPPHSLPGCNGDVDYAAMNIIREAARYLVAHVKGETRTLWNIHNDLKTYLLQERKRAAREAVDAVEGARNARLNEKYALKAANDNNASVYFVQAETGGPIKIGKAVDPVKRLKGLQTSHHEKLIILATTSGGYAREEAYHRMFADHRIQGEWFHPHQDILMELDILAQNKRLYGHS